MARTLVGLIVVGGLVAGGVIGVSAYRRHRTEAAPATWDPRITDLVGFVERERGLTFDHPVASHFLPEDEFVRLFDEPTGPADPERDQLEQDTSDMYSALGLASNYDPSAGQSTIDQVSILGFYDPAVDEIFVRGDDLTPEVRTVLVHELTHALQAQHFQWRLGGPDDLQVRSVVEADAMRIENRYVDSLPASERAASDEGTSLDAGGSAALADVPWAMMETDFAPYVLGPSFLEIVEQLGGAAAVDDALRDPPDQEQLLDPWSYVNRTPGSEAPAPPTAYAPVGADVIYRSSTFELFDATVMLDAWLPWQQTRRALDGWNGGAMIVYAEGDQVCTSIAIREDDAAGAQRLADAVTAWSAASGSTATPTIGADDLGAPTVTFDPCQRADGAPIPSQPTLSTSYELTFENNIVQSGQDNGTVDHRVARCAARLLIDDPAFNELAYVDELTPEQSDRLIESSVATRTWCENDPAALPDR